MIIKLPQITVDTPAGTLGDNITIAGMSLSGSVFNQGKASITFYEKPNNGSYMNVWDMPGEWTIYLDGVKVWTGYTENLNSTRYVNLMRREVTLVDKTEAWDILLKDKVYPVPASDTYTVGNLISDLANEAAMLSGVGINSLPDNSTLLKDILKDKQYVVRSSTYLAELNKVMNWVGFKIFADPAQDVLNIIDPNNTPTFGSVDIQFNSDELMEAGFDFSVENIATTVVVGDEVSGKAVAYGSQASTPDNTNLDIRKREKTAFVTTYGIDDETKLSDVAKEVYDLSRRGSQSLKVKIGGYRQNLLWYGLNWTDANGNAGAYKIASYTINVSPQEISTTLEAIL